ncbi:MAG: hypothetical protein RJA25_1337 [Bacteroidota bacterium]
MRNFILLLGLSITLLSVSCQKEQEIKEITATKIKSVLVYNTENQQDSSRYFFYYDSTDGSLQSVDVRVRFFGMDTTTNLLKIQKINAGSLKIITSALHTYHYPEEYIIYHNNGQITAIGRVDTTNSTVDTVTKCIFLDGQLFSISDTGIHPNIFSSNIKVDNILYDNSNECIRMTTTWTEHITGTPAPKSLTDSFSYSNYTVGYTIPFQVHSGATFGAVYRSFMDFLIMGGYYFTKPVSRLLSNIYNVYDYSASSSFSYLFTSDNKVSEVRISNSTSNQTIQRFEYY